MQWIKSNYINVNFKNYLSFTIKIFIKIIKNQFIYKILFIYNRKIDSQELPNADFKSAIKELTGLPNLYELYVR